MSEWLSIETAPKDGTTVDLWTEYGRETDCRFDGGCWVNQEDGVTYATGEPSHWMPLPDAPKAQSNSQ